VVVKRFEEEKDAHESETASGPLLLKVGHHGSNTSSTPELLAAVRPQFAVISDGYRNLYGHPKYPVIQRFADEHIKTFRTDMLGATTFYLDGKQIFEFKSEH